MNETYVKKSVNNFAKGQSRNNRFGNDDAKQAFIPSKSANRFSRRQVEKLSVGELRESQDSFSTDYDSEVFSIETETVGGETFNQNSETKVKAFSFRGWSLVILFFFIVVATIVFFRKIVEILIWCGYSTLLTVLVFTILTLLYFGLNFCLGLWRSGRKKTAALSLFILLAASLSTAINQYFNYEAQKPEYGEVMRVGTEKYLAPLSEHHEFTFSDGSRLYYEPERLISAEDINRSWYKFALPAIEDRRHFERLEGAVDFRALVGTIWRRITEGSQAGASTIAMQIGKMLFGRLKNENLEQKIDQAILGQRVNDEFGAEEQISLYANLVILDGEQRGIAAAAYNWFGVEDLVKLTPEQAALLAAVSKGQRFHPRLNPQYALERRNLVLSQMKDQGYLTEAEYETARRTALGVKPRRNGKPLVTNAALFALKGGFK